MKEKILKKALNFGMLAVMVIIVSACGSTAKTDTGSTAILPTVVASNSVAVEGWVIPKDYTNLYFEVGGQIDSVPVKVGDHVAKGDVLISLGEREAAESGLASAKFEQLSAQQALDDLNDNAALSKAQAGQALSDAQTALTDAKKALQDIDTSDYQDELDDKEVAVQDAKDDLDDAEEEMDKYRDLEKDNNTRKDAEDKLEDAQDKYDTAVYEYDQLKNKLDDAKSAADLAEAKVDDAQTNYDSWKNGPDPDQLALAQSRLEQATAQVSAAQRALDNMTLTAPFDGEVMDLNHLTAGESINSGKTAVTFADTSTWYVETKDLTELDVVDIATGETVNLTPDALPDVTMTGVVESIDGTYLEKSGDILYTVRIRVENPDPALRWGMTVDVEFVK